MAAVALSLLLTLGVLGLGQSPAGAADDVIEWEFVCLINQERVNRGIAPLRVTGGLRSVARSWTDVMKAYNNLAHNPNLAGNVTSSVTSSWQNAGENVGVGYNPFSLHTAFMNSPGHRHNVLDRRYEYLGVGVSWSGSRIWTTHNFLSASVNLSTVSDPHHQFSDVCSNHPFFDEIEWMADQGVSTGYSNGTYRPTDVVTRQSMSAFLYRLAGSPTVTNTQPRFSDVPSHHPFLREISWMADQGITTGYGDGTFRPLGHVSREAMSAFMYRFAGTTGEQGGGTSGFRDVGGDHAFLTEISWMASVGITNGYGDGTFRPGDPVTRQAMSAFMFRLDDL